MQWKYVAYCLKDGICLFLPYFSPETMLSLELFCMQTIDLVFSSYYFPKWINFPLTFSFEKTLSTGDFWFKSTDFLRFFSVLLLILQLIQTELFHWNSSFFSDQKFQFESPLIFKKIINVLLQDSCRNNVILLNSFSMDTFDAKTVPILL